METVSDTHNRPKREAYRNTIIEATDADDVERVDSAGGVDRKVKSAAIVPEV